MKEVGLEFILKDGTKDSYDPVTLPDNFIEDDETYTVKNSLYSYTILKEKVISYRFYPLCSYCGYEYPDDCRYDCIFQQDK